MKHTPGPWHFEEHGSSGFIVGANGWIVAGGDWCEGYLGADDPDAVLMCAAPELLEALQLMLRQFTKIPSSLKDSEARSIAHAAIAKATGSKA